ncbi:SpoIIE family protein phosphatase [Mycobacterium sp. NBC_00419]|uniref:SpoIIE family protein phosphatase n=1 Tax=Mycobacterium sp. NBC_00419 TaxID=2975989 RepID=UPI002E1A3188
MTGANRQDRLGAATGLFGWVALAYIVGAVLSWQTFGAGIGPAFFPAAGVTVAAMILTRRSLWPVIVAAIVVAELAVDLRYGAGWPAAAGFAAANAVEALVGASVVLRWCKGPPDLRRRDDLARFVAGAGVLGPLAGGLIGGAVTTVIRDGAWLPSAVLHWWAGDGIGVLVIGAPILLWPKQIHVLATRKLETALILLATAALSVVAFVTAVPPALLLLPVMAWAALRLDVLGAALAGAVLALTANVLTDAGYGTFARLDLPAPGRLAVTQAFIAVVVLVSMLIAQEAAGRVAAIKQREAERRERLRLGTLARLGQLLSGALTQEQIGDAVESQVLNDAGASALTLGLVSPDGTRLEWVTMAGYPEPVVARFGRGVSLSEPAAACEVVRTGQPVVVRNPLDYQRRYPDNAAWLAASGTFCSVSWPLTGGGMSIGVLVLAWDRPQPLDTAQLAYASAVATMISQALVRARVYADEHARAAILQAAVLPSSPAAIDGIDVAISYEPADAVHGLGGDWYDAMALRQGRTYVTVGDVVGHGLPAVEDMAQLRSAARALALQGLSPARLLGELNTFTRHASHGKFATMSVAIFDPSDSSLSYASAGHPPPLLRRADTGEVVRLATGHGPVLGPVDDVSYAQGYTTLADGDVVVLYTDGLIERRGQDIETGIQWAQRLIRDWAADEPLSAACQRLSQTMAPAPRNDDVCVVAVRFSLRGAPS